MRSLIILSAGILFSGTLSAQALVREYPAFYVDSVKIETEESRSINPNAVARVTLYKNEEGKKIFGEEGKNGVIFIETKSYLKKKTSEKVSRRGRKK